MYSIIQELESNNSRLFKEDVIKREAEANNINFFQGCQLALISPEDVIAVNICNELEIIPLGISLNSL